MELSKNFNASLPPELRTSRSSLFEVVLLVVVCALFSWFLIFPKRTEVQVKQDNLNKVKDEQSKIASNLDNLNRLVADLKNHQQDLQKLDDALPLDGKTFSLDTLINKLAADSGVVLGDVNIAGKTDDIVAGNTKLLADPYGADRTLQKIAGNIYVIGTFSQLETFLKKLETSGRIIQVLSTNITASQNNALSMQLGVEAYYFAP